MADKKYKCLGPCGQSWDKHPVQEVPCSHCGAKAGSPCKRPSEHGAAEFHAVRRKLAWSLNPCGCDQIWLDQNMAPVPAPPAPEEPQLALF